MCLSLVAHEVTLNKDMLDIQHYSNIMEDALRGFECNECVSKEQQSLIFRPRSPTVMVI